MADDTPAGRITLRFDRVSESDPGAWVVSLEGDGEPATLHVFPDVMLAHAAAIEEAARLILPAVEVDERGGERVIRAAGA